jgi:hypothetical protein
METKELLKTDLTVVEKRSKRGKDKELTPAEKQLVAEKEAAKLIVAQCCANCLYNVGGDPVVDGITLSEQCKECYSIYNGNIKRYWVAMYKKVK